MEAEKARNRPLPEQTGQDIHNHSLNTTRPVRTIIYDELGRERSLASGPFVPLDTPVGNGPLIFLGLGPDLKQPQKMAEAARKDGRTIYWVECPDFVAQMPGDWRDRIPPTWIPLTSRQILQIECIHAADIFCYAPAEKLFSFFWGPLLAALKVIRIYHLPLIPFTTPQQPSCSEKTHLPMHDAPIFRQHRHVSPMVILPGGKNDLMTMELEAAFQVLGFLPMRIPTECVHDSSNSRTGVVWQIPSHLVTILRDELPTLFLSVNLRGLDPEGRIFRFLQACDVPVAIWCVDNPWHLFSALRCPWWKEAAIFVTDASFVQPLREHGVAFVRHLPLAAWEQVPQTRTNQDVLPKVPLQPITFVGRSAFPDRDRFFAGSKIPSSLWKEAKCRLGAADPERLPHVHWWEQRLGVTGCWPGHHIRQAGLGAEQASMFRRLLWLLEAERIGLTVFGDPGWNILYSGFSDLRSPVDYYRGLFNVYKASRYCLNVTSLLLPQGLTQRHFDVWMAGGFLLTDATPGLHIFPRELVRPISLEQPSQLSKHIEMVEKDTSFKMHLAAAWKEYLRKEHSYIIRIAYLLHTMGLPEYI